MTREDLHALVWSKPMRIAAKERGISDVALAKQCRRASVPVPPRGYWNKVQAGKKVIAQPLPSLLIGPSAKLLSGLFPAYASGSGPINEENPERPEFTDLDEVTRRIESAVGSVRIPTQLVSPHPVIVRLLRLDEERRVKVKPTSFSYDFYGPKFDKPIQKRRLYILEALLITLGRFGLTLHGSTHAGERFSIEFRKGLWVYILVAVENGPHGDPFYRDQGRAGRQPGERLRFDITSHSPNREPPSQTWRDGAASIEKQLSDIIVGILLKAERGARQWALSSYKWTVEAQARKVEEAHLAAERIKAERIASVAAATEARLSALFTGADCLERADRIRRYVASVRELVAKKATETIVLEQWATWALAQADSLDPVLSGRIAADLRTFHQGADLGVEDQRDAQPSRTCTITT